MHPIMPWLPPAPAHATSWRMNPSPLSFATSRRAALLALCLIALVPHPLTAQPAPAAPVRADQPWARATAPSQSVGGAYVTLTSPVSDRLLGGSSPVAGRVELHEMRMDGAIMRMRELGEGLPLPANTPVAFAPGGYHLMLVDLKQPLVAGQTVQVTLRFQNAPPLDLVLPIAPVGAPGPHAHK